MRTLIAGKILFVATLSLAATACGAGENDSLLNVNVNVTDEATSTDTGLPAYPGSKPYRDSDDSKAGANIGLSTPLFGLQVSAIKLETSDSPERVAAFYRKALSKYGDVLECRDDTKTQSSSARSDDLTCDSGDSGRHDVVYKVGSKSKQRIVAIEPHDDGTRFSLVRLAIRGD